MTDRAPVLRGTRTLTWRPSSAPAQLACTHCGKSIDAAGGAKAYGCLSMPWDHLFCSKRCLRAAREEHHDR